MPDQIVRRDLEAAKAASVPQLLFKAARLLNAHAVAELQRTAGLPRLRASHTALFPHLDLEGTRLTELARRLGMSKQAVAQWVDELVEMDVLERLPDPDDRRAKRIAFRGRGKSIMEGLALLASVESELREAIGEEQVDALHEALTALLAWLEDSR